MAKRVKKANPAKSLIGIDPLAWLDESALNSTADNEIEVLSDGEEQVEKEQPDNLGSLNETEAVHESTDRAIERECVANEQNCNEPNQGNLLLNNVMKLESVRDLFAKLKNRFAQSNVVEIDAHQVEVADTAGLQLLSVFAREAAKQGINVSIKQPSESFMNSAKILGLDELIELTDLTEKSD